MFIIISGSKVVSINNGYLYHVIILLLYQPIIFILIITLLISLKILQHKSYRSCIFVLKCLILITIKICMLMTQNK